MCKGTTAHDCLKRSCMRSSVWAPGIILIQLDVQLEDQRKDGERLTIERTEFKSRRNQEQMKWQLTFYDQSLESCCAWSGSILIASSYPRGCKESSLTRSFSQFPSLLLRLALSFWQTSTILLHYWRFQRSGIHKHAGDVTSEIDLIVCRNGLILYELQILWCQFQLKRRMWKM